MKMGDQLTEIALLLISVSVVTLLVTRAGGTIGIINAGTSGFNNLLRTVTAQNNMGVQSGGFGFRQF